MPEHQTGCIDSEMDEIADFPAADISKVPAPVLGYPPKFELEMPPVVDQGKEGSCCAFACAYAARSYLLYYDQMTPYTNDTGSPELSRLFSPEFVYNTSKAANTEDCSKAGMKLTQGLDLIKSKGAAPWSNMPYSAENGCSAMPDADQWKMASRFKVKKVERIGEPSERLLKQVLFNKTPVIFSAAVDHGFMKNRGAVWNKTIPPGLGNHAMVLCGWDDDRHAYKVMNSWGSNWGDKGYGWIDYDHFSKVVRGKNGLYEMFVMTNGYDSTLLPTIRTLQGYSYSNVLFSGEILDKGAAPVTDCGICYSTAPHPTIQDEIVDGMLQNDVTIACNPLEDLKRGTTYYVRAYAINAYGLAYGNEIRFYIESESAGNLSAPYYPGLLARVH